MTFQPETTIESLQGMHCDFLLKINCKQINIRSITCVSPLEFSYPYLEEQAFANSRLFQCFRDLNSLNAVQRVHFTNLLACI